MIRKLRQAWLFLEDPRALRALVSWPTFSITSYRMSRVLQRRGISPKTVIDVGANVGQFAVSMAETFAVTSIHAFEPLPTAAADFRRHTTSLRGVTLHETALGEREGTATLRVSANSVSSSLLPMRPTHREIFPGSAALRNIEVPVTTLDRALAGATLVPPVLLKVDAQGYEAHVLRGGSTILAQADHVLIETSLVPLYEGEPTFTELISFLGNGGLAFEAAVGFLESPKTGELLQLDALFGRA